MVENSGTNSGAKRATLRAGAAGYPVCMANQTTQMVSAQMLKNRRVNQSIKAPKLRLSVGNAKAAKVAIAGNDVNMARSDSPVNQVAPIVTAANQSGKPKWGKRQTCDSCPRQRHSDHSAKGHAGQENQAINLAKACKSIMR